jgi:hypothetical protein
LSRFEENGQDLHLAGPFRQDRYQTLKACRSSCQIPISLLAQFLDEAQESLDYNHSMPFERSVLELGRSSNQGEFQP